MREEKYFFEDEVFSKLDEFFFDEDEELIDRVLLLKDGGKVLELGCGISGNALALAEEGFDVTCVDISSSAINAIRKEAKVRGVKLNAIVCDLEEFEISDMYDVVIAGGVLHFLSEDSVMELIDDVRNHTKKDGLNIFEVLLEGDDSEELNLEGYYFKTQELKELYKDWEILDYEEYEDYEEDYEDYEEYDGEDDWQNKIGRIVARKC